ncbi:MAG: hypothetical protein OXI43_09950 [Candidatus Poribacteria bacterium]|nr:hypothetical protein [Candidatus Poribacteria bacterium]
MHSPKHVTLIFIIGFTLLTLLGCDENSNKLVPPPTTDLMFKEKLVGTWDVVSVNDIDPSRFLTVLIAKTLNEDVPGEVAVPAAPEGEFVIIEDELDEVYHTKADVQKFYYTFDAEDTWTLHVQFDILPNEETLPVEGGDASDPGGDAQNDPVDPNKPAAPAANGAPGALGIVAGTWTGTYQVAEDMLTLTTVSEEARVTPHLDTKDTFEEIAGATEAETQAELTEKFRIRLITPFHKTFIEIDDDGRLILKIPGSSRGKMILEKR